MKEQRHQHPHKDPRYPIHGISVGTNPPVFTWKPVDHEADETYHLVVACDPAFHRVCLEVRSVQDPVYLPQRAFDPGVYSWKWSVGDMESEVFSFEVTKDAAVVEVPAVTTWFQNLPAGHPRIYLRPENLPELRESWRTNRADEVQTIVAQADKLVGQSHHIDEPPFLPDARINYTAWFSTWIKIANESRAFVGNAENLALAYLITGDERYGRAACRRMASISQWNPEGSSHIAHNDEAHMPVIWHGPVVCDWVWDLFTDEERKRVIDQFAKRGRITYEHMHDKGMYGVTRFDSHAGREIVFLALVALVFHDRVPEAKTWLRWLRPVLCGIWPIWAGDDGGWGEGPSYGQAYIQIMTMFASALKRGTGVDLYRRPFWQGHARWKQYCWPSYAEWIGFGDHTERSEGRWRTNTQLMELIWKEGGAGDDILPYIRQFRKETERWGLTPATPAKDFLIPDRAEPEELPPAEKADALAVFPYAGWAAVRTNLDDAAKDVALVFRSSPFGSISHSHAANNDFFIHVGGHIMAMPSGYFDGWASRHHSHWVWHTKSHNCVTLSDASQIMRSPDSAGEIVNAVEDKYMTYFAGVADSSYSHMAERYRRHVLFLKEPECFLMVDEVVLKDGIMASTQWNIHSWNEFTADDKQKAFSVKREDCVLKGKFLFHEDGFFSKSEGWDPEPMRESPEWPNQYHLRYTPLGYAGRRVLPVVLDPVYPGKTDVTLETGFEGGAEVGTVSWNGGEIPILVNSGQETMQAGDITSDALIAVRIGGILYEIGDKGVTVR